MSPLARHIEQRTDTVFGAFLLLHVVVWTLLPTIVFPSPPLDLIEAFVYGREWVLGSDKLPPLPWWIAEIAFRAIGHDVAYYLASALTVAITFVFVWLLARETVGRVKALFAVLIVDGIHAFNYTAPKFNHDVVQLPFWALAGLSFHRALTRGRTADWLLLGFAVGGAFWAKYFVVVLLAPLLAFTVVDREARQVWRGRGPWLAAATAFVIVLPHLIWLVQNDFSPLGYAGKRADLPSGLVDHLIRPAVFAAGQIAWLVPPALIAACLLFPLQRAPARPEHRLARRIVAWLAFGPAATVLLLAMVTGRHVIDMWGYPLWLFYGVWVVGHSAAALDTSHIRRGAAAWALVAGLYVAAFIVHEGLRPIFFWHVQTSLFPGEAYAAHATQLFESATGRPLKYVVADVFLGGHIERYGKGHPRVVIDGDPKRVPWIDPDDVRANGAIVAWHIGLADRVPDDLMPMAAGAIPQPPRDFRRLRGPVVQSFKWAILYPAGQTPPR